MNHFNLEMESPQGGNYGLMDQQMAIEFIYENAELIGGDPQRITIFGESAGALSVSLHITAPQSKMNFQRAIMHRCVI